MAIVKFVTIVYLRFDDDRCVDDLFRSGLTQARRDESVRQTVSSIHYRWEDAEGHRQRQASIDYCFVVTDVPAWAAGGKECRR